MGHILKELTVPGSLPWPCQTASCRNMAKSLNDWEHLKACTSMDGGQHLS